MGLFHTNFLRPEPHKPYTTSLYDNGVLEIILYSVFVPVCYIYDAKILRGNREIYQ